MTGETIRRHGRRRPRALVVGVVALAAAVTVTTGCTGQDDGAGRRSDTSPLPAEALGPFLPVLTDDGLAVVGANAVVLCDLANDANPEGACRVAGSGTLPAPNGGRIDLLATTDADATGVALLSTAQTCDGDECTDDALLVTCTAQTCRDDSIPAATVTTGDRPPNARISAIAAGGGRYALVVGREPDVDLILCSDASCRAPQTISLGSVTVHDIIRVQLATDGTLWIAQSDVEGEVVRVSSLAPGAATVTPGLTLDLPDEEGGTWSEPYRNQVLRLSVRADGSPVVLYRDPSDDALVLVSCDDASCSGHTASRPAVDPAVAEAADLAVDPSGRPLIATSGAGGVQLHSCTDLACNDVDSRSVSSGAPLSGPDGPFLLVADGRPLMTLSEKVADGPDRSIVLRCQEARCGL